MGVRDEPALLSTLESRLELLDRLAMESARKRELAADLDVSRSTIERAVDELVRFDLIECAGGIYRTTVAGELALEEFDRFSRRVRGLGEARDVLASLPSDATFDPSLVVDAEVHSVDRSNPRRATGRLEDSIADADFHRAFAPASPSRLVRSYRDAIADGLEAEFAVTPDVLDGLLADHGDLLSEALETGRVEFRETRSELPYGLVVAGRAETVATALVYADGKLDGVVYADAPEAVSWATATLEGIWTEASPLPAPGE